MPTRRKSANQSMRLMMLFSVSSAISIAVILAATFLGIGYVYTKSVLGMAERQSVEISQALFLSERDLFTDGDTQHARTLSPSNEDFAVIERRMRDYLKPFNIVKIKVYNKDKEIIHSTDHSIIGMTDHANSRLILALDGLTDAELVTKGMIMDLNEEARIDVDVVETYVPIHNHDGQIIGAAEIYMDVSGFREQLSSALGSTMMVIALVLASVFGVLFLIMRHGTNQLHRHEQSLYDLATTDPLTRTANRRSLLARADEAFTRAQFERSSGKQSPGAGFILIDLDHFKAVNDTHGHQVGDVILRKIADRFGHCIRHYDTIGRYGGEEFLVIVPDSDARQVKEIAERIWHKVRGRPFEVDGLHIDITVSIGYACVATGDTGISDVIKRADDGLYQAKTTGRDQVVGQLSANAA